MTHFIATSSTGSRINFLVMGTARIQGTGTFGSIVQIFTQAGVVVLDGRAISFEKTVAPVFEAAGFAMAPTRRRLLDLATDLVGFFRYLANYDLDALEAAGSGSLAADNATHPGWPGAYTMEAVHYVQCDVRALPTSLPYKVHPAALTHPRCVLSLAVSGGPDLVRKQRLHGSVVGCRRPVLCNLHRHHHRQRQRAHIHHIQLRQRYGLYSNHQRHWLFGGD